MISFSGLINVEEFEKRDYFSPERGGVSFYCKDCKKIVDTDRKNSSGYEFICKQCFRKNISIGTLEGLKTNYKTK